MKKTTKHYTTYKTRKSQVFNKLFALCVLMLLLASGIKAQPKFIGITNVDTIGSKAPADTTDFLYNNASFFLNNTSNQNFVVIINPVDSILSSDVDSFSVYVVTGSYELGARDTIPVTFTHVQSDSLYKYYAGLRAKIPVNSKTVYEVNYGFCYALIVKRHNFYRKKNTDAVYVIQYLD